MIAFHLNVSGIIKPPAPLTHRLASVCISPLHFLIDASTCSLIVTEILLILTFLVVVASPVYPNSMRFVGGHTGRHVGISIEGIPRWDLRSICILV